MFRRSDADLGDDNWEHRAYWGANYITTARMDGWPALHGLCRLLADGAAGSSSQRVGLEGRTVNGMPSHYMAGKQPGLCREDRPVTLNPPGASSVLQISRRRTQSMIHSVS